MVTLVIGKQNSGKSRFAEELAVNGGIGRRYYLATMKVCDDAGEERIERHRKQREGKGFITIELQYGIDRAVEMMEEPRNSVVLLECIANLVGNEMYDNPGRPWRQGSEEQKQMCVNKEEFTDALVRDIKRLEEGVGEFIIVTNEYDATGVEDEETLLYIELINCMNEKLAESADEIYRI